MLPRADCPGTRIDRVKFQRGTEGHPLDDIVICAHDSDGHPAILEIQVKRSLQFTSSDQQFLKVVAQIAKASQQPGFFERRYELAVAIGRASLAVQGAYQYVRTWARQMGSVESFIARIERPYSANRDMRNFVNAFRTHLEHAGAPNDDEMVWRLLSRLQILHFDFPAEGSAHEAWQRERAANALHPDDVGRAEAFWRCLVELAIEIDASGGDRDRNRLVQDVQTRGFRLAGEHRYASARSAIAEDARHALEDMADRFGNVRLTRGAAYSSYPCCVRPRPFCRNSRRTGCWKVGAAEAGRRRTFRAIAHHCVESRSREGWRMGGNASGARV